MHVGTRLRITLHGFFEDFVIANHQGNEFYAVSISDPQRYIKLALGNEDLVVQDVADADVHIVHALVDNTHVDGLILAKADIDTLSILSELDEHLKSLSRSNDFWLTKIEVDFGEDVVKHKPRDISPEEFYIVYNDIHTLGADAVLIEAAENGTISAVKIALWLGADVNADDEGTTALMNASLNGNIEIVRELLEAGADVNAMDNDRFTALILASMHGYLEIVKELLDRGANVNVVSENNGETALTVAAEKGHLEVVRELLAHGARVNHRDYLKTTALGYAIKIRNSNLAQYLRAHGAQE